MKSLLALGAFFVLVVGLSACGSGVPGDAVVNMDGNPVTTQAFKHWMYVAAKGSASQSPGSPVIVANDPPDFSNCIAQVKAQIPSFAKGKSDATLKSDCKQLFTSLSGQVMDFLIRAYWYQAEAHKQGISVSDSAVQKAFQTEKKQQFPTASAFNTFLTQSGQTLDDIIFRVRVNEIYKKLLAKHNSTVTPAAIQSYYTKHQSQFGTPETRDIRIIRTNSQSSAEAAKKALEKGQSWDSVAKKYSVDSATKNKGGLLKAQPKSQLETALGAAAFSATPHKVIGPIHGQFGYYVVEVEQIHKAKLQSLAKATPLIKQILTGQQQTNAQTAVDNQAKKDWQSKTKCRADYSMADCAGYKPPKAATSLPGTGTAAPSTATTSSK